MRPLRADEIEVRIGTVGAKGVTLLLYKDARVDRAILDEVYGEMNWQDTYKEVKGNLFCAIGVWDEKKAQWVWKEDCGTESFSEKEKGEASDAFKRAGFRWGIGIELYTSPFIFLPVATENRGNGFKLVNPNELRGMYVSYIDTQELNGKKTIMAVDISQGKTVIWSTDRRKVGLTNERS